MSIKAMTHVWETSQHKHSTLLVLLAIADYANDAGQAWPSIDSLARKARTSRRQVIDIIKRLEAGGELGVAVGASPFGTNIYTISGGAENANGIFYANRDAKLHPIRHEQSSSSQNGAANVLEGLGAVSGGNGARKPDGSFGAVIHAWESLCGPITTAAAEQLNDLADEAESRRLLLPAGSAGATESGPGWLLAAIEEATRASTNGRVSVNFVNSILSRWYRDGFKAAFRKVAKADQGGEVLSESDWDKRRAEVKAAREKHEAALKAKEAVK
jgi:hypothetical protein